MQRISEVKSDASTMLDYYKKMLSVVNATDVALMLDEFVLELYYIYHSDRDNFILHTAQFVMRLIAIAKLLGYEGSVDWSIYARSSLAFDEYASPYEHLRRYAVALSLCSPLAKAVADGDMLNVQGAIDATEKLLLALAFESNYRGLKPMKSLHRGLEYAAIL